MATHCSIFAWSTHGQRSLAGYSPWGHKELDTTERINNNNINNKGLEGGRRVSEVGSNGYSINLGRRRRSGDE